MINYTINNKIMTDEEEAYYDAIFENLEKKEKLKSTKIEKISALVEKVQNSQSIWEKKFVYGVKKNINNSNDLSNKQQDILDKLFVKYGIVA